MQVRRRASSDQSRATLCFGEIVVTDFELAAVGTIEVRWFRRVSTRRRNEWIQWSVNLDMRLPHDVLLHTAFVNLLISY
jgi:hypothetical protein